MQHEPTQSESTFRGKPLGPTRTDLLYETVAAFHVHRWPLAYCMVANFFGTSIRSLDEQAGLRVTATNRPSSDGSPTGLRVTVFRVHHAPSFSYRPLTPDVLAWWFALFQVTLFPRRFLLGAEKRVCKSGSWVGLGRRTEVREKPLDVSRLGGTSAGCLVCKLNNQPFKTKFSTLTSYMYCVFVLN